MSGGHSKRRNCHPKHAMSIHIIAALQGTLPVCCLPVISFDLIAMNNRRELLLAISAVAFGLPLAAEMEAFFVAHAFFMVSPH